MEKIIMVIDMLLLVFFSVCIFILLAWSAKKDEAVMKTEYCFQERADGSYYHYVCEK